MPKAHRRFEVSNPERLLFPDAGITKLDLIEYYEQVAPALLPHIRGRPLSLQRFPEGIGEEGFYQKRASTHFPDWIRTVSVESKEEPLQQVVCNNVDTLAYLANLSTITLHPWLSRMDRIDRPDRMVFDLDPASDDFEPVRRAAFWLRKLLEELELPAFVQTTGSRGLHVVVPIQRRQDFDTVRALAMRIARLLVAEHPAELTTEFRRDARRGRLFVDTLRNGYGQTAVAPYAARALPGAPVATPLDWDELEDSSVHARTFDTSSVLTRLGERADPWVQLHSRASALGSVRRRVARLAKQDA